ncbi:MAG: class I SAM-dependent methyltransferase [Dolichospermum sp.]
MMNVIKKVQNRLLHNSITKVPSLVMGEKLEEIFLKINKKEQHLKSDTLKKCSCHEDFFNFTSQEFGSHQIKSEIIGLLDFVKSYNPQSVCEIGTADGGTNFLLSQAIPSVKLMIGVDLFVKNKFKLSYFSKSSQEIKFVDGSSYDENTMTKVKQILGDRQLDLLFIDGDHNYEGVKKDFLKYRHLVREGGIIVFHDIVPDYFTRHGVKTGRWVGGVPIFWNEIKSSYQHWEFIENTDQDGLGIGVIQYSSKITFPEGDN